MTYEALPPDSKLIQSKTKAFLLVKISDNVDVGLWWQKTAGDASGKLKATLQKQSGSTVNKTSEAGEVVLDNTAPQRVKVLIVPADVNELGNLKIYVEFKFVNTEGGDEFETWMQADVVTATVIDDPIPE